MILGVSFDDVAKNRKFAEKYDFPFQLLCDSGRELGVAYGAADAKDARSARRVSYLIAPDGKIAAVWDKVAVATHADDVLGAIAK